MLKTIIIIFISVTIFGIIIFNVVKKIIKRKIDYLLFEKKNKK